MRTSNWVNAQAALSILKVRAQTLYANVSRRRIRAKPDPADTRRSLYHVGDVSRLAAQRRGRPSHERIAAQAASWGTPILASGISTVVDGRLWYRGQDAVALAQRASLEQVAALLWECAEPPRRLHKVATTRKRAGDVQAAIFALLAQRAAADVPMLGRAPELLKVDAGLLFAALADSVVRSIGVRAAARTSGKARLSTRMLPLHERLARAWHRPGSADRIRRALVLLADHELNASTFATRVAASTGAPLSACVLAGFSTLSGPLHGSAGRVVRQLVDAAARSGSRTSVQWDAASLKSLPAFGHPLYPDGDVRAQSLLRSIRLPRAYADLRDCAETTTGELPNVDFALAALSAAEKLPEDAAFVIFALGRSVGWMAHALEQAQSGTLIRPRARYSGPALNAGRERRTSGGAAIT